MKKVILFDFFGVLYEFDINKDILELARSLKKRGFLIGILSNVEKEVYEDAKEKMEIDDVFDYVFTSSEIGYQKPQKEIYIHVIKKLETKPENIIFIDDSRINVDAAKNEGIDSVMYVDYESLISELEDRGINFD